MSTQPFSMVPFSSWAEWPLEESAATAVFEAEFAMEAAAFNPAAELLRASRVERVYAAILRPRLLADRAA